MFRTVAFVALALSIAGCTRYHSRAQGPFAKPVKEPPPPYGASAPTTAPPRPVGGQSPLGIASADPATPLSPDDQLLVPPKTNGLVPAGGAIPAPAAVDPNEGAFPPFKNRPQPKSGSMPSPFAPKDPPVAPKEPPGANTPGSPKAPPKNATDPPTGPSPAAKNLGELKALVETTNTAWKAVDTFEATITRRELNPNGDLNSEVLIFQFRREPMSVFTRTVGENGKGREIVYFPAKHGDRMYVMLGEGDNRLAKAGFIAPPMSPDDPRVKAKARYSIREAGFGRIITVLSTTVAKLEAGRIPPDQVVFDGEVKRPEYAYPLVGVTHKLRPGDDPLLPTGGTRLHFFDMKKGSPGYGLPVLVVTTDSAGKEVEYYLNEKITSPAGLTDADFDPARLKKK